METFRSLTERKTATLLCQKQSEKSETGCRGPSILYLTSAARQKSLTGTRRNTRNHRDTKKQKWVAATRLKKDTGSLLKSELSRTAGDLRGMSLILDLRV